MYASLTLMRNRVWRNRLIKFGNSKTDLETLSLVCRHSKTATEAMREGKSRKENGLEYYVDGSINDTPCIQQLMFIVFVRETISDISPSCINRSITAPTSSRYHEYQESRYRFQSLRAIDGSSCSAMGIGHIVTSTVRNSFMKCAARRAWCSTEAWSDHGIKMSLPGPDTSKAIPNSTIVLS